MLHFQGVDLIVGPGHGGAKRLTRALVAILLPSALAPPRYMYVCRPLGPARIHTDGWVHGVCMYKLCLDLSA